LKDHIRTDPAQAAMVNRAFPIAARTALDRKPYDGMAYLVKRSPAPVIRRAEDGNACSVNSIRKVSWASIIADKQIQFTDQRGQSSKRSFASQVDWLCHHLLYYRLYNGLFIRTSSQDYLCIESLDKCISKRGKVSGGPAAGR